MDQKKFDVLIRRLELEADRQPSRYKFKVFLLATLGYGYIFFILVILLLLNGVFIIHPLIMIKFGIPVLFLTFIILRALWVTFPPPEGTVIRPEHAKPLFELLKDIQKQLKGPKIHTVLLTSEFNAAIIQNPRLGVFGWPKNYLIIGLPLMQALSTPQFTAVLAHEYGHLSGAHSHFSAWIYRIRKTWAQIVESLEKRDNWGITLFNRFFEWYIPFFNAYSFVLARLNEYEADRRSAEFIGSNYAAQALINVSIKAQFLEHTFWPKLYAEADNHEKPPYKPFSALPIAFNAGISPYDSKCWLKKALEEYTSTEDTHPCLTDRLESLGEKAQLPESIKENAAQYLFGENYAILTKKMNRSWTQGIKTQWQERFHYAQSSKSQLKYLKNKAKKTILSIDEIWQQAALTEEFNGEEAAFPLYQAVLKNYARHPFANYALGRILLERGDEQGIHFIERAMDSDGESIISGCELIYNFLISHDRVQEAKVYANKALKRKTLEQRAQEERETINQNRDNFAEHGLTYEECQKIALQLAQQTKIKRAYMVKKVVQYLPENPLYVLCIVRTFSLGFEDKHFAQQLADTIDMPGEFFVVVLNQSFKKLQKKILKIDNSLIYKNN